MALPDAIIDLMPAEGKEVLAQSKPSPPRSIRLPAKRPAYSVLGCDKLERTFGLRLPHLGGEPEASVWSKL